MKLRRMLSSLLAVIMVLSILPFTVSAAEPSATAQGVTVTIDKSSYEQGEEITISYSGMVEGEYGYDGAFTIAKVGAGHKDFVRDDTTSIYNRGASGTITMNAPSEDGEYELRLYTESFSYFYKDSTCVLKIPLTVGKAKTGTISLPQTEYIANKTMLVDYSGITAEMVSAGAFVGIFKESEKVDAFIDEHEPVSEGAGQVTLDVPNINGKFEVRLYNVNENIAEENNLIMSLPITISGATASEWAVGELEKAEELGLIPEILEGTDLTADITRAEFAAVAVKVYENLSGTPAIPIVNNPFTDTKDVEILKAYNIGAVNGTSATTYEPDALLNREQAAAMLTRVFKRVTLAGWTLATDSQFTLPYEKPALFADDADISDWAKESVYFMVANNIINGVGNNKFAPKNVTTEEQAQGYANATREQALLIAVRMVENLK